MKAFLISLIFLVSMACGRNTSELKIVHGQAPRDAVKQSTVSLVRVDTGAVFCSATIIAKQLVLTAAHCITDKAPQAFNVRLHTGLSFPVAAMKSYKAEQKYGVNFDVAWIRVEGVFSEAFPAIEILRDARQLQGQAVTIAGYGQTASRCLPNDTACLSGRLFEVSGRIREFLNAGRWHNLLLTQFEASQGPCLGDSGGPLFVERKGRSYLAGSFVGWDKRLVPEQAGKVCDNGQAIYNAAGPFFDWIESSSGLTLPLQADNDPFPAPHVDTQFQGDPTSFVDWCQYRNEADPAWYMMQRLVSLAGDYALTQGGDIRRIFSDCAYAEENLLAKIKEDKGLDLDAYAPDSFGPKASISDLTPLLALQSSSMNRLTLSGHALSDLRPLASLRKLRKLEIIDNQSAVQVSLDPASLNALETLTIKASPGTVKLEALPLLKNLRNLSISNQALPDIVWEGSQIRNLRLEDVTSEGRILLEIPKLNFLVVKGLVPIELPPLLPDLQNLDLEGLSGFTLPVRMPKLKVFRLVKSVQGLRLKGALRLEDVSAVEQFEFADNKGIEEFILPQKLPRLRELRLSGNGLRSIHSLIGHIKLTMIDISKNQLETLPYLEELPLLSHVNASQNQLHDLSGLESIRSLTELDGSENPLENLEGLNELPELTKLTLEHVRGGTLDTLDGLGKLPKLLELRLARNSFRSVNIFLSFTKLQVLVLSENKIQDIAKLKALTSLDYLEIVNNPLQSDECPLRKANYCRFEWLGATD